MESDAGNGGPEGVEEGEEEGEAPPPLPQMEFALLPPENVFVTKKYQLLMIISKRYLNLG